MNIRKATKADVKDIVKIHCSAFSDFFLTSLGTQFLDLYYTCFITDSTTITFVAEENAEIIGFSASTKICKGFNSRLVRRNVFSFALFSLKLFFLHPLSLFRLIKNMTKKSNDWNDEEDYAELYSIGVLKDVQGMGIGKKLLVATEQTMKEEGVFRVSLTTDFYNNDQAVGFYHSMGYKTLYVFTAYPERRMYRLIKEL